MSRRREEAGAWVATHRTFCKALSCLLLILSLALVISGCVFVINSQPHMQYGPYEQAEYREYLHYVQLNYTFGCFLIMGGVGCFVMTLIPLCCTWQIRSAKDVVNNSAGGGYTQPAAQWPQNPPQQQVAASLPQAYQGQQTFFPQILPAHQLPYQPMASAHLPVPPVPPRYDELDPNASAPPHEKMDM